jgi:hypothetical protein
MTKRTVKLSVLILFATTASLFAQQKAATNKKQPEKPKVAASAPKAITVPVYLGNSDQRNGGIQRETFNNLLRQGLTAHDSANNKYKVVGFDLGYADRGLYEDSVGNIIPVVDFASIHCNGEKIPAHLETSGQVTKSGEVSMSLYERIKPGDTLYFDRIRVLKYVSATETDSVTQIGKSMKFYITR